MAEYEFVGDNGMSLTFFNFKAKSIFHATTLNVVQWYILIK